MARVEGHWNLDGFPVAVLVYDDAGDVIDANDAACALLGADRSDVVGSSAEQSDWLVVDSGDGPITVHPAIAALRTGQPVRAVLLRVRRPDATDVWLQVDAVPEGSRVVASLTDVTYLIASSRITSRSAGDHIVDEVTDSLAYARLEPKAVLDTVTRALARLRPRVQSPDLERHAGGPGHRRPDRAGGRERAAV